MWKSHFNSSCVQVIWVGGSLEIFRAGQTVLAKLMESQIWYQPAGSVAVGGGSPKKGDNGLCLGESCAPALALMPDTSGLPCMFLVPFKLLPSAGAQRE